MSAGHDAQAPARRADPRGHPGRRIVRSTLTGLLAGVTLALMGFGMFQNSLLYFPTTASVGEMTADGLSAWPSSNDFRGLLAEPSAPPRATAIVLHGNAGHAGHRRFYAEKLTALGIRVVLAEYPAYGPRAGNVGEDSLLADARQTVSLVAERFPGPLLIIGESLGAAVAAGAWDHPAVSGVLLITPWDRLENVARHHYPLLPVKWLLRDHYDSVGHLRGLEKPIQVVLANDDTIIPPVFGRNLYDSLSTRKRLTWVDQAGHNDWFDRLDAAWWRQTLDFLLP